jgi:uncharacterized protein (TIGR01777 family)
MNYLITGGTGLIGKAFIDTLPKDSSTITVLTRNVKQAKGILGPGIHFIDALSIVDVENTDVVLNLAGEAIADKRWSGNQKDKICHSRWHITEQLVELINQAKKPPSIFISGSAVGIYGRQEKQSVDECFEGFYKEFTYDICSTWENIALTAASDKTRVAILRTGIVLAKNKGALGKMLLPFKLGLGGKMGSGEQMMSWIHIEDMIEAIQHIQNNSELQGAINLTAPNPVSNEKFTRTLASLLNRPCLLSTPSWLLRLLLGEMSDILLYGQQVIPAKLMNTGFVFKYPEVDKAIADLLE